MIPDKKVARDLTDEFDNLRIVRQASVMQSICLIDCSIGR